MGRSYGAEKVEAKCRKDKDHDLCYRPGPPAEFMLVPMRCMSYISMQQRHLLQCLQPLST